MRFFKLVLNLVLLAGMASIAGTASASSACNMRDGSSLFENRNPERASVSKKHSNTRLGHVLRNSPRKNKKQSGER